MDLLSLETLLALAAFGVSVGLASSFLGLGGGIVVSPLLPLVIPITQKQAVATSLMTIVLVVSFNTFLFHRDRLVHWKTVGLMGPLTAAAALLTGAYMADLTDTHIRILLILVVMAFGFRLLLAVYKDRRGPVNPVTKKTPSKIFLILLSLLAGFLSATSGIGSGLIISPSLLQFQLVESAKVVPTANGVMIFTTLFGVIMHVMASGSQAGGDVGPVFLGPAIIISIVSIFVVKSTKRYRHRLSDTHKKLILGGLLLFLGAKLVNDVVPFWN